MRLLITSGATREPIDGVRFISNFSTGKTGAALADFFTGAGFAVTYLKGEGAAEPVSRCELSGFSDFADLNASLKRELGRRRYFAVIHLAAVSDYSVSSVRLGERSFSPGELAKIDSHESGEELGLVLKRNLKIVDSLKSYATTDGESELTASPLVVAFKLTNSTDRPGAKRAADRVAASQQVDAVVHNDLAQMRDGSGVHRFAFFRSREGQLGEAIPCAGTGELGAAMVEWFREHMREGQS